MSLVWQDSVEDHYAAYMPESAYKLGLNIFAYASAMRAWAKNAAYAMKFIDNEEASTDKVSLVQIVYDGVWKTRHVGLSVLLHTFNQRTDVPVKFKVKQIRLNNRAIFNSPLLYITGHEHFSMSKAEVMQLRKYLQNGGFLLAEACCGRKGFDLAFRQLMKQALPTHPLKALSQSASVFATPHQIKTLGVTPTLNQDLGASAVPPMLEGVEIEGNTVVVYSRFGLAGGWEMSQSPYAKGYDDVGSIKLGHNILMYAITQ